MISRKKATWRAKAAQDDRAAKIDAEIIRRATP
jgi:hypothetical protein